MEPVVRQAREAAHALSAAGLAAAPRAQVLSRSTPTAPGSSSPAAPRSRPAATLTRPPRGAPVGVALRRTLAWRRGAKASERPPTHGLRRDGPRADRGKQVVLHVAPERFVLFAHLKPGGVLVREAEQVEWGARLAQCGNSGNTSAPHLAGPESRRRRGPGSTHLAPNLLGLGHQRHEAQPPPSTAGSTERPPRTSASSARPTGDSGSGAEAARLRRPRERAGPRQARARCEDGAYSPTRAHPRTVPCETLAAGPTRTAA
jgi:hypothetical protein